MRWLKMLLGVSVVLAASSANGADLTGFWKTDCEKAYGLQIMPASGDEYSISFCGPGGCFEPGTYRSDSTIVGDASYRIRNFRHIEVLGTAGWTDYYLCTKDTHPELTY